MLALVLSKRTAKSRIGGKLTVSLELYREHFKINAFFITGSTWEAETFNFSVPVKTSGVKFVSWGSTNIVSSRVFGTVTAMAYNSFCIDIFVEFFHVTE